MSGGREYEDYVGDIVDAVEKIQKFTEGMQFQQFKSDDKTIYAVVRALEIIGEAAKKVPPFIKAMDPSAPWREMAGMRDKLIHEYFGVNVDVLWRTIREDLPPLKPVLKKILDEIARSP